MNFRSDTALSVSPKFMDFGLSSVITTDELGFVLVNTTRIRRLTDSSNWLTSGHDISEATEDILCGKKAKNH